MIEGLVLILWSCTSTVGAGIISESVSSPLAGKTLPSSPILQSRDSRHNRSPGTGSWQSQWWEEEVTILSNFEAKIVLHALQRASRRHGRRKEGNVGLQLE